jgi:capsular polysaccharide biosynthesis protein
MTRFDEPRRRQISLGSALLRRGWILIACAVAVAALAYAVAKLQSASYSAQAVLNVPASLGPSNPGSAQQAGELASSYKRALPRDDRLSALARHAAGRSGTIRVTGRGALLTLSYTASSRTAAVKGARELTSAITGQHPSTPVVAAGTLQLLHRPSGASRVGLTGDWRASGQLLVGAGAGASSISADNSNKLAASYADALTNDDSVMAAVAHAVPASLKHVRGATSIVADQNTSILRVTYKDSTAQKAARGARAFASAVTGAHPATNSIVPGSLQLLSLPKSATTSGTLHNPGTAVPVGAVLGFLLGLILLIAWERSDPHITRSPELSRQVGCPATPVNRLSEDSARALLDRWAALSNASPARVALVPASRRDEGATQELATYLLDVGGDRVVYEDERLAFEDNGHGAHSAEIVLVRAAPPGSSGGGELAALGCDLTVIVVPKTMKAAKLRTLSEDLADFGVAPDWALLLTSGRGRGLNLQPPVRESAVTR